MSVHEESATSIEMKHEGIYWPHAGTFLMNILEFACGNLQNRQEQKMERLLNKEKAEKDVSSFLRLQRNLRHYQQRHDWSQYVHQMFLIPSQAVAKDYV